MGALSGTSAVQVLGFSKSDQGNLYLVMEMLDGVDLETHLHRLADNGDRLSFGELVELIGPIVETLDAAHARGIIHRDLKPANIFVLSSRSRGAVRLLDFGLAKDLKATPLTMEGMIAGSPSYIAPEVWRGKPDLIDHRIDVYSLGAVIFRALAGRTPFDGKQPIDRLLIQVTRGERPSLHALRPDLPPVVDPWVQKALAISRDERFQDVRSLWTVLVASLGASGMR
jgi:serine/threonine-protein kinase